MNHTLQRLLKPVVFLFVALPVSFPAGVGTCRAAGIVTDHNCTDIHLVPTNWIVQAKQQLHIAYGHTSHGSQLTDGMSGLVAFMNGLGYPSNLYAWNNGGSGGVLDLHDYAFSGASDLGNPDFVSWATSTRTYLDANTNCNVVIWSWCGEVSGATEADINTYLTLMDGLEADYTNVMFVHMTGHLDGGGTNGNLNIRNNQIRDHCLAHDEVLYDFANIESFDPDGLTNYMALLANDNCDYDSDGNSSLDRNWATDWQSSHTENVDWYSCSVAHSQPLNGNRKAYAAWWLWARLAGWPGTNAVSDTTPPTTPTNLHATAVGSDQVGLAWNAASDPESGVTGYRIYRSGSVVTQRPGLSWTDTGLVPGSNYAYEVTAINGVGLESTHSSSLVITTVVDNVSPSTPSGLTATAVSSSQIDLSWLSSTDNVAVVGYRIYRDGSAVDITTGTSYSDTSLSPAQTYSYRVTAFDAAANESAQSAPASATTLSGSQTVCTNRLENSSGEVEDTFIYAATPDSNYGSEGYRSTTDRFLIKFNLPTAMTNRQIVEARLYFYVWNQSNYQTNQYMDLYRVTRPWVENEATWNRATSTQTWQTAGGDYDTNCVGRILHQYGSANWDHTFYPPADITPLAQKWVSGAVTNHGLLLINSPVTGIGLKASEYSAGARPYLEIRWIDEPGPYFFEVWQQEHFTAEERSHPALETTLWGRWADPDGDALPNVFEYALGEPPRESGGSGLLIHEFGVDAGGRPTVTYHRARNAQGIGFDLLCSTNLTLNSWSVVSSQMVTNSVEALTNGLERVDIKFLAPPASPATFYRLRLTAE
jgi:hypothetical protein